MLPAFRAIYKDSSVSAAFLFFFVWWTWNYTLGKKEPSVRNTCTACAANWFTLNEPVRLVCTPEFHSRGSHEMLRTRFSPLISGTKEKRIGNRNLKNLKNKEKHDAGSSALGARNVFTLERDLRDKWLTRICREQFHHRVPRCSFHCGGVINSSKKKKKTSEDAPISGNTEKAKP